MHDLKTTYSVANLNITDHYKFNFRQLVSISRTDDFKSVNLTNQYIQWFEILRFGEIQVEIAFGTSHSLWHYLKSTDHGTWVRFRLSIQAQDIRGF